MIPLSQPETKDGPWIDVAGEGRGEGDPMAQACYASHDSTR